MQSSSLSSKNPTGHAIVIGGGIAGLLAARVLLNHFEEVTLLERDRYPDDPVSRAGAPQGRHIHVMLMRGQQILEELFPGIGNKLVAQGAHYIDFLNDVLVYRASGWLPRFPSALKGFVATRTLTEWQIRQELVKYDRVRIIEGNEVVGLLTSSNRLRVTGVQVRERNPKLQETREPFQMVADLVIDATGRNTHASQWLASLGYTPPEETRVNPCVGYASRLYELPPDPARDWKVLMLQTDPPIRLRSGIILPIEGNRWIVSLVGTGGDYPPTEEEAFTEFARSLPEKALYEAFKDGKPLSPVYGYRRTENRVYHFEKLSRLPEGFVVLGDAACSFNPVYAQGMTVATLGAMTLDETLREQSGREYAGLPLRFQRKLARLNALPWRLATAADYRVPTTEGARMTWSTKLTNYYFDSLVRLLPKDLQVSQVFNEVLHMVRTPSALFQPAIVLKVLGYSFGLY